MIFYYILLIVLLFLGVRICRQGISANYISKESTNVIKGFFIALIFMSHIQGYIRTSGYTYDGWGDGVVLSIQEWMGQLVVVMFLFYSGYGIMESYKRKGEGYVKAMPKKRLLTTLLNFDVAVLLFMLVDILLGIPFGYEQGILSLVGWDSVGNSNWYIFVILICYLNAYVGFLLVKRKPSLLHGGEFF